MPRTARASLGGFCYHVINRGNARARVFHDRNDYREFVKLIDGACERVGMRALAYCLMPNHFHLVLWPFGNGDLSRWMQWLLTAHVRRHHKRHGTDGHVWQGRFKAFPIEADEHLLMVLRYVERNALRADLVQRAQDWPWSSLALWTRGHPASFLSPWPLSRPDDWVEHVNAADKGTELTALRQSVNRCRPWGSQTWVQATASQLGLEFALRPRGRPKARNGDILNFAR